MELHEAARRLGVHYQTAYKWVRDGSLVAVKQGAAYEIDPAEVERRRIARLAPIPPPRVANVRDWSSQTARLRDALMSGDELAARAIVDRLAEGGIEPLAMLTELFTPVLKDIGERWEEGTLSIAEEHRATAICDRLLTRIAVHPRGRPRGVAVVATPPADDHGLPAAMAAVALRADRWQVHHLGPGVPIDELVAFSRGLGADLVVVSVTNPAARAAANEVRRRLGPGTRVLIGRPGRTVRDLVAEARAPRRGRRPVEDALDDHRTPPAGVGGRAAAASGPRRARPDGPPGP